MDLNAQEMPEAAEDGAHLVEETVSEAVDTAGEALNDSTEAVEDFADDAAEAINIQIDAVDQNVPQATEAMTQTPASASSMSDATAMSSMNGADSDMAVLAFHQNGALESLLYLSENTIYLMGLSFVLGSLFTILILILLDFMRRNSR